jgi:hypothetical protein
MMRIAGTVVITLAGFGLTAACSGSGSSPAAGPSTGSPTATPVTGSAVPSASAVPAESNPPGDIPDGLAFVPYSNAAGHYRFVHPEGWAQVTHGSSVTFSDKLNGVSAAVMPASRPPTTASARSTEVPRLQGSQEAFQLSGVQSVQLPVGKAILVTFRRNSAPDPVTGRKYRDDVQEYLVWKSGRELRFDLFGVVGADNVDAYRTMVRSIRLS